MRLGPRLPDRLCPCARPAFVLGQVANVDEVQDGELARSVASGEHGKVGARVQHASDHVGRAPRRKLQLEPRAQSGEVDEHRLTIAPVRAVPGMLGHVGVDDKTVCRRVPEMERFVGLYLPEDLPAPRGARDVSMHRTSDSGHGRTALRAQLSLTSMVIVRR